MDWLWPIYEEYVLKLLPEAQQQDQAVLRVTFMRVLGESTATLFVMEPVGDGIVFRGLGRWPLREVPELLVDPNGFIDEGFGGGKFKVNFHHVISFVGTHNFRTYSEEKWRQLEELDLH
jgi:hypothetical protein